MGNDPGVNELAAIAKSNNAQEPAADAPGCSHRAAGNAAPRLRRAFSNAGRCRRRALHGALYRARGFGRQRESDDQKRGESRKR